MKDNASRCAALRPGLVQAIKEVLAKYHEEPIKIAATNENGEVRYFWVSKGEDGQVRWEEETNAP